VNATVVLLLIGAAFLVAGFLYGLALGRRGGVPVGSWPWWKVVILAGGGAGVISVTLVVFIVNTLT